MRDASQFQHLLMRQETLTELLQKYQQKRDSLQQVLPKYYSEFFPFPQEFLLYNTEYEILPWMDSQGPKSQKNPVIFHQNKH